MKNYTLLAKTVTSGAYYNYCNMLTRFYNLTDQSIKCQFLTLNQKEVLMKVSKAITVFMDF